MAVSRTVDITPDKSLMEKLGSVGFTPEEAVSEFIDNAIDAQYDMRTGERLVPDPVTVEVFLSSNKIVIKDDAAGIADFDRCMKTAWSEKSGTSTLGRFGLGMKTASMSLGRRVTVRSKRIGESIEHTTRLDLDEWFNQPSWTIEVEETEAGPAAHFTEISIEKPYVEPSIYLEELRERLADRFGPFVDSEEATIKIDGRPIVPPSIAFLPESDVNFKRAVADLGLTGFKKRLEFSFTVEGHDVAGWIDFMLKRSPSGKFGFNIYRGKRLIQPFIKIGMLDHATNSNLFGHLYLAYDFPVAFTKNKVEWRAGFLTVKRELERICADHKRIASRMAQEKAPIVHPKVMKDVDKSLKALTDGVAESNLLKRLFEEERKRALETHSEGFGSVDSEKRRPRVASSATRPIPKGMRTRNPAPDKPRQKKNFWFVTVGGLKIKLYHDWIDSDEPKMWYSSLRDEKVPWELSIQTNVSFDAYDATSDKMYYATSNVIMALSRVIHDALFQRGQKSVDLLEIQEDLFLNWSRRIKAGVLNR